MSGEQPKAPPRRPPVLVESQAQSKQPFPTATDLPPLGLAELNETVGQVVIAVNTLTVGQSVMIESMDALAKRVVKLEADAAWKAWVVRVGKTLVPIVSYLLGAHYPELAKFLPALLGATGATP